MLLLASNYNLVGDTGVISGRVDACTMHHFTLRSPAFNGLIGGYIQYTMFQ